MNKSDENRSGLQQRTGRRFRRRILNDGRAAALRRWVLSVFGDTYLRTGSGILDVAGGKGEVAFEFENLNGIPTCVVDPRALELHRFNRKLELGFFHRNEMLGRKFNPRPRPALRKEVRAPTQIRAYFQMSTSTRVSRNNINTAADGLFSCDDDEDGDGDKLLYERNETSTSSSNARDPPFIYPDVLRSSEAFAAGIHAGRRTLWTNKGLEKEVDDDDEEEELLNTLVEEEAVDEVIADNLSKLQIASNPESNQNHKDTSINTSNNSSNKDSSSFPCPREICTLDEARSMVQNCSIVVGMHPDQAAEHILDFAVLNDKPCAFIPCCVYSRQFPRRRSAAGQPVRKYGDLIEYLLAKLSVCVLCTDSGEEANVSNKLTDQSASRSTTLMKPQGHVSSTFTGMNIITAGKTSNEERKTSVVTEAEMIPSLAQFGIVEMDFEGKNLLIFYTAGRRLVGDPYASQMHVSRGPARPEQWRAMTDNAARRK